MANVIIRQFRTATKSSLGKRIFVDDAILHDDQELLVGVFDELDVFQRIAIDQQQICEGALFHDTKLAGFAGGTGSVECVAGAECRRAYSRVDMGRAFVSAAACDAPCHDTENGRRQM